MKRKTIKGMLEQLEAIEQRAATLEKRYHDVLQRVHPTFAASARNLVHYRALRQHDIRDLQNKLGNLGLSRLGRAESHIMASVKAAKAYVQALMDPQERLRIERASLTIKQGKKLLNSNTKALLGNKSKGRRVRMMVTLPSTAAHDEKLVYDLVASGMNSVRINCAHDDAQAWKQMIDHVNRAKKKLRRSCKVCMDLGGPKIRTGSMEPGPQVVHFRPERDPMGRVVAPAIVCLMPDDEEIPLLEDGVFIPVPAEWLASLEHGEHLDFIDTRDKKRTLRVVSTDGRRKWAYCHDGAYVMTGTLLQRREQEEPPVPVGELIPIEQKIILNIGDTLVLHQVPDPGQPAVYDEDGNLLRPAHIACAAPEVFEHVAKGDVVQFDDGKVSGIIRENTGDRLRVEVTYAKEGGAKLRADKGINFPNSQLRLRGLTQKDRTDLAFIAEHADVVNMSFVNTAQDVQDLLDEIGRLGATEKLGITLKIETRQGFDNLTDILLTAMQVHPIGVMIARGDLAIEVGWENMGYIQEEIMSLCAAAHVPDIWATQVLENLAKKGLPSRAEITDAAMAQRAECVMLNKGPHILKAIQLLDDILKRMRAYQDKKAPMLPPLKQAKSRQVAPASDQTELVEVPT